MKNKDKQYKLDNKVESHNSNSAKHARLNTNVRRGKPENSEDCHTSLITGPSYEYGAKREEGVPA